MHIVIDANIGVGKTTLISKLKNEFPKIKFWDEEVDDWCNEGWLQKYYSDKKRYASSFQMRVLLSHIEQFKKLDNDNINLCERSAYSTLYIFSQMLLNDGTIDSIEFDLHEKFLDNSDYRKPDLLIFLKADPDVAYFRLLLRSRNGESELKKEYLNELDEVYSKNLKKLGKNVEIIDANMDENIVLNECKKIIEKYITPCYKPLHI